MRARLAWPGYATPSTPGSRRPASGQPWPLRLRPCCSSRPPSRPRCCYPGPAPQAAPAQWPARHPALWQPRQQRRPRRRRRGRAPSRSRQHRRRRRTGTRSHGLRALRSLW